MYPSTPAQIALFVLAAATLGSAASQAGPSTSNAKQVLGDVAARKSCRSFVQAFYAGYLRKVRPDHAPANVAITYQPGAISPELKRRLSEELAAAASYNEHQVGLAFDPYLFTQDIADACAVENVRRKGSSYLADVYSVWSGKRDETPTVIAELVQRRGRWQFVNFHYGIPRARMDGNNLLNVLRDLRQERRKQKR